MEEELATTNTSLPAQAGERDKNQTALIFIRSLRSKEFPLLSETK